MSWKDDEPPVVSIRSTTAPPTHCLWARDQFLALSAAAVLGRCGGRACCPARWLPCSLAADAIGRRWVMQRHRAVSVRLRLQSLEYRLDTAFWIVVLSETGGALDVAPWRVGGYRLWLSDTMVVDCSDPGAPAWAGLSVPAGKDTALCCNSKWILRVGEAHLTICGVDAIAAAVARRRPGGTGDDAWPSVTLDMRDFDVPKPKSILWVNSTSTGDLDEVAVCLNQVSGGALLLFVDIKESYSSGTLCIKERLQCFRTTKKMLHSDTHRAIALMYHGKAASPLTYDLRSLGPNSHKVLRKCKSTPHKVDSRHFVEVTDCNHRLEVFSTEDLVHPCNVIHNETRIGFQCGSGIIAFLEDDRFVIVDAVTGSLVLSQPVPFEKIRREQSDVQNSKGVYPQWDHDGMVRVHTFTWIVGMKKGA
ncbi:hypothetical protein Pelo_9174 [Pelomyxa schiedti]|nr:hypothetical protein Pelo_9174 [Pelomyxa schiedti]